MKHAKWKICENNEQNDIEESFKDIILIYI